MVAELKLAHSFITDERELLKDRGFKGNIPLRVFKLAGLRVDEERFLRDMVPTFLPLPWDWYDVMREQVHFLASRFFHERWRLDRFLSDYYAGRKTLEEIHDLLSELSLDDRRLFERIKPRRRRSVAYFVMKYMDNRWEILRNMTKRGFTQKVGSDDLRSYERVFAPTSPRVTDHPEMVKLMTTIADMVRVLRPTVTELELSLHQVTIYADIVSAGSNSPEGIHQDGADYIVSALVVERDGVIGGESFVYGPDKQTILLQHVLQPGEGIFQADKGSPLWHDVTLVKDDPATPEPDGRRSIFGFDINIVKE